MKNFISLSIALFCVSLLNAQLPVSSTAGTYGTYRFSKRNTIPATRVVDEYFEQTLITLSMVDREDTRYRIARQLAERNLMSSDQVRQIMQQFYYDNTRIDYGRFVFNRVSDPMNFGCIAGVFQDPRSVAILENYIGMSLISGTHVCNDNCHHYVPAPVNNCGNNNGVYYTMAPMNAQTFCAIKRTIQAMSFESSKMVVLKQELRNNYFSSEQVKELMLLFSFESSRLEIAKLAYRNVVDPENYFIVNEAFSFESSVMDLDRALYR